MTMVSTTRESVRRKRLLTLLEKNAREGTRFARIGEIDALVNDKTAAMFLKHDVHGLSLESLLEFATAQRDISALGSYFFMAPDHPLTKPHYSFKQQAAAMRAVRDLGHEVGLHIDPYFLMDHTNQPLRSIMQDLMTQFLNVGVTIHVGNMHGHSQFKMPDRNGFGTMFDLFVELGRQPNFPTLADVPNETADIIRANRISVRDFGIAHWADMPMWSAQHGFVITNFVTDNQLGKRGTIEFFVHEDTIGQYKLADHQPPGSRTPCNAREFIPCNASGGLTQSDAGRHHVSFESDECLEWMNKLSNQPTLVLIHPEHYC